jgi:dihydroflavonol-4-reductase
LRVFVTGATGFIGYHVAKLLIEKSFSVRALVRESSDLSALKDLNVELFYGDLRDKDAIMRGVKDCRQVYHVAADYRLWVPNPRTMYEINIDGTRNVMTAALAADVERVVYTSTVGVWPGSRGPESLNETAPVRLEDMIGHYKKSKFLAEKEVFSFVEKGLPVVIVNPSAPVGPMDRKPTPTGKIIIDFLNGKVPAYLDTGLNFIDVEDVAQGHWSASVHGGIGQRYILGNRNMKLKAFFETLGKISGRRSPRVKLPYLPALFAAYLNEAFSRWITHQHPSVPLVGVKMAQKHMFFDCSKAVADLKLPQSSVKKAMGKAVAWFVDNGYIKGMG